MVNLTDKQTSAILWIVGEVNAGNLPEEEILFTWSKKGLAISGYKNPTPSIYRSTLDLLEEAGYLYIRRLAGQTYLVTLKAEALQLGNSTDGFVPAEISMIENEPPVDKKKILVVHGRDSKIRLAMFDFLRSLKLEPIEWSEAIKLTGVGSPYIGDVLDVAFSHAQAVVVLLTPDDLARLKPELLSPNDEKFESELTGQARPNVLFEAGLAFGRHRDRTILIQIGQHRKFSDIEGRHVVRMDGSPAKRKEIATRLTTAGCDVSTDGDDWLAVGDFKIEKSSIPLPTKKSNAGGTSKFKISVDHKKILAVLAHGSYNHKQIAISLKLNETRVHSYLDDLQENGYVRDILFMDQLTKFALTKKGRKYVVDNDLVP